ncbi:FG-GAP-like repeat-containing protein [Leptospira sp. GIMC2001]|uniref:FG-GAP-like repeat-containing protein n=1 Tax=Leptospira sp. GIMC2001 TaxID=1513297 RepID=UPI002349DF61|nr:FG-GAP-like repeat-containing protein [Leptospira sp. GIMC2001]WCL47742.1 FG-GAP-like repeat-containing protein [Leptospira sp. GIMC2001]
MRLLSQIFISLSTLFFSTSCLYFQENQLDPNAFLSVLRSAFIINSAINTPDSPTFLLIKNNSVLESGFTIGKAAADVTVEVSLDDGDFVSASGSENWKFKLPTGSNSWKLGSLHKISVRSVKQSLFSQVTSISVRKGKNRDVNGDGFPDLIVGAVTINSIFGELRIFLGSEEGITATVSTDADSVFTGTANGRLGEPTATGDFNGDGFADILTSANLYAPAPNTGRVYILYGGENGIASIADNSADVIITGNVASGRLAIAVASGDLNSDGYDEAILGTGLQVGGSQGRVYIINGQPTTISSGVDSTVASSTISGTGTERFGDSLLTADINGDGNIDLVVGAPSANNGTASQGSVYLYYGTSTGLSSGSDTSANTKITGTNTSTSSRFGCSMDSGDINGDRIDDLLIGACGANTGGTVYIFNGSNSGISSGNDTTATNIITSTKGTNANFGNSIRSYDLNGDGFYDVVVGSYGVSTSLGEAYIFNGSSSGVSASNEMSANYTFTGTVANGEFGRFVAALDYDSDSNIDILVSAPGTPNPGAVHFFKNSGSSVTSGSDSNANKKIQAITQSAFGLSIGH